MSQLASVLPGLAAAMQQQQDKLNELVVTELLMAQCGRQAVDAFESQLAAVKLATAAHATAAADLKKQQDAIKSFQKGISDAGATAAVAFSSAVQFSSSLAQAANPTAWETMQDSLGLVAMQLGQAFLPTIIRVSIAAQQFAQWLRDLSPATKEMMSYVAGAGAALYAFTKAASVANTLLLGLPGKLMDKIGDAVTEGLAKRMASGISGPMVQNALGVAAMATAAVAAAKALWDIYHNGQEAKKRLDQITDERTKPLEEKMTRAEFEETDAYKKIAGTSDPEERKKVAMQAWQEAKQKDDEAAKADEEARAAAGSRWRGGVQAASLGMIDVTSDAYKNAEEAAKKHAETTRQRDAANAAAKELAQGGEAFRPSIKQGPEAFRTSAGKKAEQAATFLGHVPKEMTPHFSAVDEARKSFQMGALKDPLEQQKLAWERENNEAMAREIPRILRQIEKNSKDGGVG